MITPSPQYDYGNEAQFRSQLERDAIQAMRTDRAITSFLMADEATGQAYRITINAGAWVINPA